MRYVCLLALTTALLRAQDGSKIYQERCASCHDHPAERVPALQAVKAMSGEAIYRALTSGSMKTQAQGLNTAELFALIGFIAPTGSTAPAAAAPVQTCKTAPVLRGASDGAQWNGWSTSFTNTRFQDKKAARIDSSNVGQLKLKWAFNLGDTTEARAQPSVIGQTVFIGSTTGYMYALDAETGCTHWAFKAATGIRGGATLGSINGTLALFFADGGATVYALDAETGQLLWKVRPVDHYTSLGTAAPRFYKGVLYQPFASFEEAIAGDPTVQCCTFRGSVVALDAATGKKLWQTFTIDEAAKPTKKTAAGTQQFGPSGAGVWSTPTIDEKLGALYVATGDNYSDPPTNTSDAVLAMDLKTGRLLWSKQLTENDAFNNGCGIPIPGNCPEIHGGDFDFGQPPILLGLEGSKRALVIAQKSGMVHAIDPDQNGSILWQTRAGAGGPLGGSQWGSASDGRTVYVAISDVGMRGVADPKSAAGFKLLLDPAKGGGLHALDVATGKLLWSAQGFPCAATKTDCSPAQSAAVSVAADVVFSGSLDGHLRAYAATTGKVLWDIDTARSFETVNGPAAKGGSLDGAGPAIVNGMLFVNSGYGHFGGMPGNALLVFGIN
jgi:polyvinyl alcohol dehydrogenase (cytochrome)